jgi:hypothetical protein
MKGPTTSATALDTAKTIQQSNLTAIKKSKNSIPIKTFILRFASSDKNEKERGGIEHYDTQALDQPNEKSRYHFISGNSDGVVFC